MSGVHEISRGLPQGGVLSPLLWLIYFNQVPERLKSKRQAWGEEMEEAKDLIYADDVTSIVTADTEDELKLRAHRTVRWIKEILKDMALELNEKKTANMLVTPYYLPEGLYRRRPGITQLGTKQRQRKLHELEAKLDKTILDFDPFLEPAELAAEDVNEGYPYPLAEKIRVLGKGV